MIKPGIYRHYKGRSYEVTGTAIHSETLELMVIYKPMYISKEFPGATWVRPLEMFNSEVEIDGIIVKRFSLVENSSS